MHELKKNLDAAQRNLSRIQASHEAEREKLRVIEGKIGKAEQAAKRQDEDAVLAGRAPGKRNPELAALRTQAMAAEEGIDVYGRALARAQQQVDALTAELKANELEILRAKFEPARLSLYEAFGTLMDATRQVSAVLAEVGQVVNLEELLFPLHQVGGLEPIDYEKIERRCALMSIYNLGLRARKAKDVYHPNQELAAIAAIA